MRSWIPRVPPLCPVRVAASVLTRAAARSVSASAPHNKPAADRESKLQNKDAARHSSSSGASAVPVTTATKGGGGGGGKAEKESRRIGGSERAGHSSSSLTSSSSSSSPASSSSSSSSSSGRGGRPRHLLPAELNSLLSWPREFFANPLELLSLPSRVLRDGPLAALRGLPSSVELPESWVPTVDVREDDKAIEIHSELAGIKPDDIHLSVKDGHLTLQGERKHVSRDDTGRVHRLERSYGTFLRRFTLPEGTDANAIKADLMEGVLRIHIPKHTPNSDESDGVRVPIEKRAAEATAPAPSSSPSSVPSASTASQSSAIAPPVSASLSSAALSAAANAAPPPTATSTSSSPSSSATQSPATSIPTPTPASTDGSARGDESDGDPDDRGDPATVATARPAEGKSTPLSEPAAPGRGGETPISV